MAGSKNIERDKALILDIIENNNQKAYATLLNKYKKSVYFTILKIVYNKDDAEDLTMKAFTKAFRNLDSYNDNYAFTTWLFKIGSNTAIDFMRKKRLKTTSLDEPLYESESGPVMATNIVSDNDDPEEEFVKEQKYKIIREVIDSMDEKYKLLIQAYFFEELKYEEISERYEIPLGTVKVRLKRAKEFLYKLLENKQHRY